MPKITEEQKEEFYRLYKQGFRGEYIGKRTGISVRYARYIVTSFDSGDYSWLATRFRHYEKAIIESEKVLIVKKIEEENLSATEAVHKYGFPFNILMRWKRNYNK